jgi:hypothetical protein
MMKNNGSPIIDPSAREVGRIVVTVDSTMRSQLSASIFDPLGRELPMPFLMQASLLSQILAAAIQQIERTTFDSVERKRGLDGNEKESR